MGQRLGAAMRTRLRLYNICLLGPFVGFIMFEKNILDTQDHNTVGEASPKR